MLAGVDGFNPYFTGCSTSTIVARGEDMGRIRFQSLFYWMFYFNEIIYKNGTFEIVRFQSLFYWMFYFNCLSL